MEEGKRLEARRRLMDMMPLLSIYVGARKVQQPDGELYLAVLHKKPDGGGTISASWMAEPFVEDLVTVLGFDDLEGLCELLEAEERARVEAEASHEQQ